MTKFLVSEHIKDSEMIKWIWSKVMKWGWDFNRNTQLGSDCDCAEEVTQSRHNRKSKFGNPVPTVTRRVEHNYDDSSVIQFKVIGANGGMIVETTRYDEKRDNENIRRYVIDETADVAESIGKIVTVEYLR